MVSSEGANYFFSVVFMLRGTSLLFRVGQHQFRRMSMSRDQVDTYINEVLAGVKHRDGHESTFVEAVEEVISSVRVVLYKNPQYLECVKRCVMEERAFQFRVPWVDKDGVKQINRGFRIQMNSAIGPYKGGLRFHNTVNLGVLKFLAFEQVFKNALTTLPMGGGKGGSDFDPHDKTEAEVERFCQSFMTELHRHIGAHTDVPAGDIGVGGREVGFLFGQYKRLFNGFEGVLTGKGMTFGGSNIRPEATGYGEVYFSVEHFKANNDTIKGKKCFVSGSGNVATYCCEKLIELGAFPLTMSDSSGVLVEPEGFTQAQVEYIMDLKNNRRERLGKYMEESIKSSKAYFVKGASVWGDAPEMKDLKCDVAYPSATQWEIDGAKAQNLANRGCKGVYEGANMPSNADAIDVYKKNSIVYGPGKAANAGGVAVSGLEMAQNALMMSWSREEVDARLQKIMHDIYTQCADTAEEYGKKGDYQFGANAAGFLKVAEAMKAQGWV